MSDLGLFFEQEPRSRGVASAPAVLNPYKPRPLIPYDLMTREEIIEGAGTTLTFDIECFVNFFLVAFRSVSTNKVILFQHPLDAKKLAWIVKNYTVVGFNSIKYDMPLLWAAVQGLNETRLKAMSNDLISGTRTWEVLSRYGVSIPKGLRHIDLIEVAPGHGGLKLYAARLHAPRIQDLPFSHDAVLEDWQKEVVTDYCVNNDLAATGFMFEGLQEQLELRRSMSLEYGQDLMSKSDAQIAEAVIGSELTKISGKAPQKPRVVVGTTHRFKAPNNLKFQTEYLCGVLATVESAEFNIDKTGYLIRPPDIENLEIKIGGSVYRMGIGGLHSSEVNTSLVACDEFELAEYDVSSFYPNIILNCGLSPQQLGPDFHHIYKGLVVSRLDDKKAGRQAQSESKKIICNSSFGKTANPYSILYAPEITVQVTVGGQLYLLMLIEALEQAGLFVVSANTDGVMVKCPAGFHLLMEGVIEDWERATGFMTEAVQYRSWYARDVNAYLCVGVDGKVKAKNIYYDPWRGVGAKNQYWRFSKNPAHQICAEAIELFLTQGVSLGDTIHSCIDIRKFLAVKNVTGGAHKNGDYLGRVVRWYIAKGETGCINYVTNGRIVADTLGARPAMDLPFTFPDDVDYDWYVRRAEGMLKDCGYANP